MWIPAGDGKTELTHRSFLLLLSDALPWEELLPTRGRGEGTVLEAAPVPSRITAGSCSFPLSYLMVLYGSLYPDGLCQQPLYSISVAEPSRGVLVPGDLTGAWVSILPLPLKTLMP